MKPILIGALLACNVAAANASVITFEGYTNADIVGDAITISADSIDVTFSGTGLSFRDFSFYGVGNALSTTNDSGPITITFGGALSDYVAFTNPLNAPAGGEVDSPIGTTYDQMGNILASVQSDALLHYIAGPGIYSVVYKEGSEGEGFVMGDFQFSAAVPEPSAVLLMGLGLGVLAIAIRRRKA